MENSIKNFIYIHAFFGGIALISGIATILAKKGSDNHKSFGKVFSYGMIISSLISLPICWMPKHQNTFLFLIGIMTIYLVISGNRILLFYKKTEANLIDKLISGTLFASSILMLILGVLFIVKKQFGGILFLFFGIIALLNAIRDFQFYRNLDKNKIILFHIGKMSGALIASITAFLVAGLQFNGIIFWIFPSIIGGFFIFYWIKKMKTHTKSKSY